MTPERWQTVKRLFDEALARGAEGREGYLAEAEGTEPAAVEEVRALLSAQSAADAVLYVAIRAGTVKAITAGTRLGPYEIVSLLGAGGMARSTGPATRR